MDACEMSALIQKKICVMGDLAVGKTSLTQRYVYNLFNPRYISTIGVNITRKELILSDDIFLRLIIWHLASDDDFGKVRTNYLQGSAGALLVSDLSRPETIQTLLDHFQSLKSISPEACVVILGNKSDLLPVNNSAIRQVFAIANAINSPYYITSAKTGEGVESAFYSLAKQIVK